jgi:ribonuclease Z
VIQATPALLPHEFSLGTLTLQGASRATAASYWRLKELDVVFDMGHCPQSFIGVSRVFLTHCHLDHAMGTVYWAAQRQMMRMPGGTIFVPEGTEEGMRRVLTSWAVMQGPRGRYDCDVVAMGDGDEVEVQRGVAVRAFRTEHSVPSQGYLVIERKEKLRGEFVGLSPADVGRLKREGKDVTTRVTNVVFAITGDTTRLPFDRTPEVAEAETLVGECTYVTPDHAHLARPMSHLHLSDYGDVAEELRTKRLVLTHFSLRYKEEDIAELVKENAHAALVDRVAVL